MLYIRNRIKESVIIRTLRLQFRLLKPLNKNPKVSEMANGSYIMGFMLFCLKLREYKLSSAICVQINFFTKLITLHSATLLFQHYKNP